MDSPAEDFIQRKFHSDGEDWLEAAESEQPFGRLLKTDEVARAIAFLASDESGMMTGTVIDFDQSVRGGGPVSKPPPLDDPYWSDRRQGLGPVASGRQLRWLTVRWI